MNTGQMLISIAAMILLGTVILNVNRNNLTIQNEMNESKYRILAVSLGNSIIEQALKLDFDEGTIPDRAIKDITVLTLSENLGPEPGETLVTQFDDFDDYNGLTGNTANDTTIISAPMTYSCTVNYVNPSTYSSLDSTTTNRTWYKKITVQIKSEYIAKGEETITVSKVSSHYIF